MEVLKLEIVGSYYYKPDFEIITYTYTNANSNILLTILFRPE